MNRDLPLLYSIMQGQKPNSAVLRAYELDLYKGDEAFYKA